MKVHRNSADGLQIEIRGTLLTLRLHHPEHGIAGSIAVKEDGRTFLVEFHGRSPERPFPVTVHDEEDVTEQLRRAR